MTNPPDPATQERVALVLVSHSRSLAEAVATLARQMTGDAVTIVCAAGAGDNGETLGTDAVLISQMIESVDRAAGVVVLMDLGSALLSTDLALDLIPPEVRVNVHLTGCAFVEGAVAAAARAAGGASAEEVVSEAANALLPKAAHLGEGQEASHTVVSDAASTAWDATGEAAIPDPAGLHARPAARLATLAGSFDAEIVIADVTRGSGPVSANSLVALSALGARRDDILAVSAKGPQASEAVAAITRLISELTGTGDAPPPSQVKPTSEKQLSRAIAVAPGTVIGPVVYLNRAIPQIPTGKAEDPAAETALLKRAIATALKSIEASSAGKTGGDIFMVQQTLLQDPAIIDSALSLIKDELLNAAAAWNRAIEDAAGVYAKLDDPYLRAREADVHDVGHAVLRILLGTESVQLPEGPPCILIVEDLAPSEASRLDPERFLGVIDRRGGPTSHASILLRAAGIPAIAGAAALVPDQGIRTAGIDGATGEVWIDPEDALKAEIEERQAEWVAQRLAARQDAVGLITTRDGHDIELWANVGGLADARMARESGALGIGLLRTEMLFLDRAIAPSEDEQVDLLRSIFDIFAGCPIVVRTLDAGGDKQIPYLHMDEEENPYLGVRGVRLCLERRPLFETQLRAVLRAGEGHDVRIMIPMITETRELVATREVLEQAHQTLAKAKVPHVWPVPLGIMVEVPAAALLAERLALESDFFSIGTNDLTQYTLAAERGHPKLGHLADAAQPAVLKLIQQVVGAGREAGRSVSVCGEAAADIGTAALLVGLGVRRLSMGAASLATIRRKMRECSIAELETMAAAALQTDDALQARARLDLA